MERAMNATIDVPSTIGQSLRVESFKAWTRNYGLRTRRAYVKNYPWSLLVTSLVFGVYTTAQFRNVIPGVIGAAGLFAVGAWYWRDGGPGRRKFGLTRLFTEADKRANQPVAWALSTEEALRSELELQRGHPGRIDPVCVGPDAPYEPGDVVVQWYQRPSSFPVFRVDDQDLEVITEGEYAQRAARMDRGEAPIDEDI
jgi:hypothetical protein